MQALVYARWSSEQQSRGDSEKRQCELAAAACQRNGWTLVETIIENGKSAYHGKNRVEGAELNQIEKRAAAGELAGKVLIIEQMDRLSRQEPLESINLLSNLTRAGLLVHESSTGVTYDAETTKAKWQDLLIAFIRAGVAFEESDKKSKRLKSAWRSRQADPHSKPDSRLCPTWIRIEDGQYVEVPEIANTIREVFQRIIDGHSLRNICLDLNKTTKPLRGSAWTPPNLGLVIRSRNALGEYLPRTNVDGKRVPTGEWVKVYPAIVTHETWARANAALLSRGNGKGRPYTRHFNMLAGLTHCGHEGDDYCRRPMALIKGRKSYRLVCSSYHRATGCNCKTKYSYNRIVEGILDNVLKLALPAPEKPNADLVALTAARDSLTTKRARLDELAYDVVAKGGPALERAYERFQQEVEDEARDVKRLEATLQDTAAKQPHTELAAYVQSVRDSMDDPNVQLKVRAALQQMIAGVYFIPQTQGAYVQLVGGNAMWLELDADGKLIDSYSLLHDDEHMDEIAQESAGKALALRQLMERAA